MRLFIIFPLLISPAWADISFSEQLNAFNDALLEQQPVASYAVDNIYDTYPKRLIQNESLQPQSATYPLKELQRLYVVAQNCEGPWPVNPVMTDALVFTRALCFNQILPTAWFANSNLIHPGGGSYAAKYTQRYPERIADLTAFFHINERPLAPADTLLGRLQRMPNSAINALLTDANYLIAEDTLWVRDDGNYLIYKEKTWLPLLKNFNLSIATTRNNRQCLSAIGNICWNLTPSISYWTELIAVVLIINLLWIAGWVLHRGKTKRHSMRERMLVLQILTHELRTPIASLSMTVESFRRQFDALPEPLYNDFRRLCEDARRLKQLAEASKDYLQSTQQDLVREYISSLKEWLTFLCHEQDVQLHLLNDKAVRINIYWLTTSLNNLINNAKKYGVHPVQVHAGIEQEKLIIKVKDQGQLSARDWKRIRKPFVSEQGLGLGLTIVESMIQRMGGKLTLEGPPTTFILEIPCDPRDPITH